MDYSSPGLASSVSEGMSTGAPSSIYIAASTGVVSAMSSVVTTSASATVVARSCLEVVEVAFGGMACVTTLELVGRASALMTARACVGN